MRFPRSSQTSHQVFDLIFCICSLLEWVRKRMHYCIEYNARDYGDLWSQMRDRFSCKITQKRATSFKFIRSRSKFRDRIPTSSRALIEYTFLSLVQCYQSYFLSFTPPRVLQMKEIWLMKSNFRSQFDVWAVSHTQVTTDHAWTDAKDRLQTINTNGLEFLSVFFLGSHRLRTNKIISKILIIQHIIQQIQKRSFKTKNCMFSKKNAPRRI